MYFAAPTQADYERLATADLQGLYCPCARISLEYGQFLALNTTFHQVCSSDFVKKIWAYYIANSARLADYEQADIRVRATGPFSVLATLCNLSRVAIEDAVKRLLGSTLISKQVMAKSEFDRQMNATIARFQENTPVQFSSRLRFVSDLMYGNTFVSNYNFNWYWWTTPNSSSITVPVRAVTRKEGCSCGTRSDCSEPGGIFQSYTDRFVFPVPGWNVSCSAMNTLAGSTLECFYNQTCIDLLKHYANTINTNFTDFPLNQSSLSSSKPSRFNAYTALKDIISDFFIEEWQVDLAYPQFYNKCEPTFCSYNIEQRHNLLYVFSHILSLYGGLTVSLRFIVPYIITLASKISHRCRMNRVAPVA